jgi:kynureninase
MTTIKTWGTSLEDARILDRKDPLSRFRDEFYIPKVDSEDSIYFCGNSLGLQPKRTATFVAQELEDWAKLGVEGHFHARHPWMPYHEFLTNQMAHIVGALPSEVVVMNSLTVNLHLLMVSFYRPNPVKYKIIIEQDAFPSDRYAVASQVAFHGYNPDGAVLTWSSKAGSHTPDLEDLENLLIEHEGEVACVFIGGVNYYTGQVFEIKEIARLAHKHHATVGIDLAHGAGNILPYLHDSQVDFAAWCTYKYLNSGPGGISGAFIHEKHEHASDFPRFAGWWGHNKETRFQMRDDFDPIPGAEGWQLSNPPILPLASLRASLEVFEEAGIEKLREKSIELTGFLAYLLHQLNDSRIELITPASIDERGCQLSILVKDSDKVLFDALTKSGVIADWREPDVIRVAPVPLYNTFEDAWQFVERLKALL